MMLSEVINKLEELIYKHGDVLVFHHDDWTEFLIGSITFQEEYIKELPDYYEPPHILIESSKSQIGGKTGIYVS